MGTGCCTNFSHSKKLKSSELVQLEPEVDFILEREIRTSNNSDVIDTRVHPLQKIFDKRESEMNRKLSNLYIKCIYELTLNVNQINLSFSNLSGFGAAHLSSLFPFASNVKILKL